MNLKRQKAIVNMVNWELYVYGDRYNLSGTADKHPKLGRWVYVAYTTPVVNYKLEHDVLTYETQNTIYICPLKYMETNPYGNVIPEYKKELVHRADYSEDCLDRIIAATAKIALNVQEKDELTKHIAVLQEQGKKEIEQQEEKENEHLYEIVKKYEDCLYIEVSKVRTGDKAVYHFGNNIGTKLPRLHCGTFQDSVLYTKCGFEEEDDCRFDFRYFPEGNGTIMETYSWSDNIKRVIIKNVCSYSIKFNCTSIAPGETKIITPEGHKQGLISPDCYNGKSALNMEPEDGRK